MNWVSLLIGVLIGWIVEWLIDVYYWRRRAARSSGAASAVSVDAAAGKDAETIRAQAAEIADLRARLTAQADLERRLAECEGDLHGLRAARETIPAAPTPASQAAAAEARSSDLIAAPEVAASQRQTSDLGSRAAGIDALTPPAPASAEDDLEIIEGIGPKIAALLRDAGISTFAGLAAAPVDQLRAILQAAGPRFRMANPASWGRQAGLAAAGRWDELKALQASLTAGLEEQQL